MKQLENLSILLSGQLLVGRTETLEDYLRDKTNTLGLIGIDNISSPKRMSRYTLYKNQKLLKSLALPSVRARNRNLFYPLFMILSFFTQFLTILLLGIFNPHKFEIFISIGCFPACVGIILKKLKKVKHVIYYCIDYFPPQKDLSFNYFLLKILLWADVLCVRHSDFVWHISPLISEARKKYKGLPTSSYNYTTVPLCFSAKFLHFKALDKIERYTLAFVGSSGYYHGLDLLFDSLPLIVKEIPEVKIKIIGVGPWQEFQKKIKETKTDKYFIIKGFIKNDQDLIEELSRCTAGIALYIPVEGNPTLYADPGKPKLYTFCGLPVIVTKTPYVSGEINQRKAGIAIDYNQEDLAKAVIKILGNNEELELFRKNAFAFANDYTAQRIYDSAFKETLNFMQN